ncbi:MAG: hypothetical protein WB706_08635 [Nitrososphaeraceae archaeon]
MLEIDTISRSTAGGRRSRPIYAIVFSLRSPYTKETYFRRLRRFFDAVCIDGNTFENRCNSFARKGEERTNMGF